MAKDNRTGRPPKVGDDDTPAVNMTVRTSPADIDAIDYIADNEGRSRSATVRRMLSDSIVRYHRDHVEIPKDVYADFVTDQYEYIDSQSTFVRRLLVLFGFLLLVELASQYLPLMYGVPLAVVAISYAVWAAVAAMKDKKSPPQPPEY